MNPSTRDMLKNRTTLSEKPELNAGYPEGTPSRVTVTTKDGKTFQKEITFPKGHTKNPMNDGEVIEKFTRNTEDKLTLSQREQALEAIWALEKVKQVSDLFPLLVI